MKKGDLIKCDNLEHLKKTMRELSDNGYHAVRYCSYKAFVIIITGEPERSAT